MRNLYFTINLTLLVLNEALGETSLGYRKEKILGDYGLIIYALTDTKRK